MCRRALPAQDLSSLAYASLYPRRLFLDVLVIGIHQTPSPTYLRICSVMRFICWAMRRILFALWGAACPLADAC